MGMAKRPPQDPLKGGGGTMSALPRVELRPCRFGLRFLWAVTRPLKNKLRGILEPRLWAIQHAANNAAAAGDGPCQEF